MPVIDVSQDANAAAAQVKAACLDTGFFYGEADSFHMAQHVSLALMQTACKPVLAPQFS